MAIKWFGEKILRDIESAAKKGVNKTMSEAVIYAKQNHPGWNNVTSKAEGSIRIQKQAAVKGRYVSGAWGSVGINYFVFLELMHGGTLQNAAGVTYPNLVANIRAGMPA